MTVRVRLPALFADRIDGVSIVEVPAETVEGAIRALGRKHPVLQTLLIDQDGQINPAVVAFHNDTQLQGDELTSAVADGDEIDIVPAIEGGVG